MTQEALLFAAILLAGLMLLHLDRRGVFGRIERPVTLLRLVSVALIAVGVTLWFV